jgi:uncharacterized protein (DUF1330 family)
MGVYRRVSRSTKSTKSTKGSEDGRDGARCVGISRVSDSERELGVAAYVIVEVETTDQELMQRYRAMVPPTVAAFGGRFLVRGGACGMLEGGWTPERIVVLEFPSGEQARGWWASEEYGELKAMRQRAGRTRMIVVEGV